MGIRDVRTAGVALAHGNARAVLCETVPASSAEALYFLKTIRDELTSDDSEPITVRLGVCQQSPIAHRLEGGPTAQREPHGLSYTGRTNGLVAFSRPMVVCGPWPGRAAVSSGRV